jgi:hypothetical protein
MGKAVEEEQLRQNLLKGTHRLQVFASSAWFPLVKQYAVMTRQNKDFTIINGLMQNFVSEMRNENFRVEADTETGSGAARRRRTTLWPEAPDFIYDTLYLHRDCQKDLWTLQNGKTPSILPCNRRRRDLLTTDFLQ